MICKHCGATLPEDVLFCTECGEKLSVKQENMSVGEMRRMNPNVQGGDVQQGEYSGGSYNGQGVHPGGQYGGPIHPRGSYNGQGVHPGGQYGGPIHPGGSYNGQGVSPTDQYNSQSMSQNVRPYQAGGYPNNLQPQQPIHQSGGFQSSSMGSKRNKKKNNSVVLLIIILLAVVVLGGGTWAFFKFGGGFKIFEKSTGKDNKVSITKKNDDVKNSETTDVEQTKKDEKKKKKKKKKKTKEKAENLLSPKEISTNEAGDFMEFLWYLDGVYYSGIPVDTVLISDKKSLEGGWKCLIWYDPDMTMNEYAHQFLNVNIKFKKERAEVVLDWSHMYYNGTEYVNEEDVPSSKFSGKWEDGSFWASGPGTLHFNSFYRLKGGAGEQYAIGTYDSPDGTPAVIALMRP